MDRTLAPPRHHNLVRSGRAYLGHIRARNGAVSPLLGGCNVCADGRPPTSHTHSPCGAQFSGSWLKGCGLHQEPSGGAKTGAHVKSANDVFLAGLGSARGSSAPNQPSERSPRGHWGQVQAPVMKGCGPCGSVHDLVRPVRGKCPTRIRPAGRAVKEDPT